MSKIIRDGSRNTSPPGWRDDSGLLAKLLETSPAGITVVDAGGQITIANRKAEEILGLAKSKAAGRVYDEPAWYTAAFDGGRFLDEELPFQKVRSTGAAVEDVRYAIVWPDGRVAYLSINASPLIDASGAFAGMVTAIEDITSTTESSLAEASLRLFRTLLDQSTDGIEVIDPGTGRFIEVNERSCLNHGYTKEEFLQLTVPDIDPTVDPAEFPKIMESLRQAGSMLWEGYHLRKDGTTFPVEVALRYVQLDRDYLVAVARDITERKMLEENLRQAQKMESVGRLAGGVAHDFNNMLTVVEGYIDLVLRDLPEGGHARQNLMEARHSSERAANVARQLLLFSRREPLKLRPVNPNTVVENLLKMLERLIGEQYSIVSRFENDLPVINADVGQIEQVLMNLVVNARDAMADGGEIEIGGEVINVDDEYVHAHAGAHTGEFVRLYVKDEGCGMDAETLSHIFEPFFSTKKSGCGTGLGLSMVYGIITRHGGWIDVRSEPGSGSVFSIFLPSASMETTAADAETITTDGPLGQGERILLVEDDESVRVLAERMLSSGNYQVVSAASAEEALEIFEKEGGEFRLVFSDVVLPGMNGVKLIERLAGRKPELRAILASGFMEEQDLQAVHDQGYRYLEKPYALTDLLRQVKDLIDEQ